VTTEPIPTPDIAWIDGAGTSFQTAGPTPSGPALISAPTDLSGRSPAFSFRHGAADRAGDLVMRVGSSARDFHSWTITPDGWGRPTAFTTGELVVLTLTYADAQITGSPDRAAITRWELLAADNGSEPVAVELARVGSMPEPARYPAGAICLTFDDSYPSQHEFAFPAMTEAGLRGTLAPIIGRFDQPGYLTSAQVADLAAAGWEISAHALSDESHSRGLQKSTLQERDAELSGLLAWHAEHGYPTDTYSYPGGWYDAEAGVRVLQDFAGVRSAYGELRETWPPAQPDRVRAVVIKGATHPDLKAYLGEIRRAQEHRALVVLVFHTLSAIGGETPYDVPAALFREFCQELANSPVAVLTFGEAMAGKAMAGGPAADRPQVG
jgi:peptidoglycan/xylan/chitin deacetylase (PgdA/CDA1 family)